MLPHKKYRLLLSVEYENMINFHKFFVGKWSLLAILCLHTSFIYILTHLYFIHESIFYLWIFVQNNHKNGPDICIGNKRVSSDLLSVYRENGSIQWFALVTYSELFPYAEPCESGKTCELIKFCQFKDVL